MTATTTEARPDTSWLPDVVDAAIAAIPFYRDRLSGLDRTDLSGLPTFDKSTTAGYGRFPISAGGANGSHRVVATSGTTGDRMCVAFAPIDYQRVGNWLEGVGRRVGLGSDDALLNTHCYGLWVGGPILDLLAQRSGAGVIPLGPVGAVAVLQFLADGVGTAISATPSYMRRLIEAAEIEGFDLRGSRLRLGFIGAEAAEESLRRKLLNHLPPDFRWVELYGLTETFGPSVACALDPDVPELELNTIDFHVEVLDPDADVPVPTGDVGELTFTTRNPDCRTPLIRYRTRDLVRATAGTSALTQRMSRILGRSDHSLKVGGVLVYPSAVAEIVSGLLPANAEWRALLHRNGDDDDLVIEAEATQQDCDVIEQAFQDRVGLGVHVEGRGQGSIARSHEKSARILVDSGTAPVLSAPNP